MNQSAQVAEGLARREKVNWETAGVLYGRLALGTAFLSAVAGRFGLWNRTIDLKYFANFIQYAAEVNSFLPGSVIPFVAWAATAAETTLGILLIAGLWPRQVALCSAALLAAFATAMAISFGLKSPMDYSVYSASSAAVLLALHASRQTKTELRKINFAEDFHEAELERDPRRRTGSDFRQCEP